MNPEELLRRAFEARTNTVEVAPDALSTIRRRIARSRPRRRAITIGLASLATTAAAVAATVALAFDLPRQATPAPPGTPIDGTPTTQGVFPAPVTTTATPPAAQVRVPVYYVGAADRLYREFHAATLPADTIEGRIAAAAGQALDGGAFDPDYRTRWPGAAQVRGVRIEGAVATVDLSGVGGSPGSAAAARASVQQLVWTVTAVTADWDAERPARDQVNVTGVRLTVNGSRVDDLWGQVDVSAVLARADALQTQALVWLITPQHGDIVNREFTVQVYGNVPESNVIVRVVAPNGQTVHTEPVTLAPGRPAWGQATIRVPPLEPGRYTVEAYFESLEDGSVQALDDHEITVR
jgi:hypothetical protein